MIYSFQHIGTRLQQEDSYHIDGNKNLFVICDGVGGAAAGEIASAHVIDSIVSTLSKSAIMPLCVNCITEAIKTAQQSLNKLSETNTNIAKSGTTLALLHIWDGHAITAHLGDSKILLLKKGTTEPWMTKDHSTVQELYDAGILKSEEEMAAHPLKNRITNALFVGQDPSKIQITTHELKSIEGGDLFILCSDGVLERYTTSELTRLLSKEISTSISVISDEVAKHSKDNSTMIAITI